jgi:hypothetical protein
MDKDSYTNRLTIPILGVIIYFLLCGGCKAVKPQEDDFKYDNLLYDNTWFASKGIKIEDILKKDTC